MKGWIAALVAAAALAFTTPAMAQTSGHIHSNGVYYPRFCGPVDEMKQTLVDKWGETAVIIADREETEENVTKTFEFWWNPDEGTSSIMIIEPNIFNQGELMACVPYGGYRTRWATEEDTPEASPKEPEGEQL